MDARTGKLIRLSRILRPDTGRAFCIAFSHGALLGPIDGMRSAADMHAVLDNVRAADAVMVSPGMLPRYERHFAGRDRPALIVMTDWQNVGRSQRGAFGTRQGGSELLATAEQSLAAGADAIMTYLWLGGDDPDAERDEIRRNSEVLRECERLGLPVMVESRGFGPETDADGRPDAALIAFHTRVAAELGADLIKTKYSGDVDSYAAIVDECQVPILVAGGSRLDSLEEAVEFSSDCVAAGAAGLIFGRNVFQFPDRASAFARLRSSVHDGPGQR